MKKFFLFFFTSLIISSNSISPLWSPYSLYKAKKQITKFLVFTYLNNLKNNNESNKIIYPENDVCMLLQLENTENNIYILITAMQSFPKNESLVFQLGCSKLCWHAYNPHI